MWFTLIFGFVLGALAILGLEAWGILFLLDKLTRKNSELERRISNQQSTSQQDHNSLDPSPDKQGIVWILQPEKVAVDKAAKEQKKKKDIVEVFPTRKLAKIKGKLLIFSDSDGSHTEVSLKGCTVEAVSASNLPSRKWAKRYPIKIENKSSEIYKGSRAIYVYLDNSWEKESWCKALRISSCEDRKRLKWFGKLTSEFQTYLTNLNAGHRSFTKPSGSFLAETMERDSKVGDSSSKVRLLLKKIAKKASKQSNDSKATLRSSSLREDRKPGLRSNSFQDLLSGPSRGPSTMQTQNLSPVRESHLGSLSHASDISDLDVEERFGLDEGTLCWNLLITRLFFDLKNNADVRSSIQARIQRTLSNMRTPSYIGEVICTDVNPGSLPPCIEGMRILPTDMSEISVFEIDIQYSGGVILGIETRLEVRELEHQTGLVDANSESGPSGEVSSDLFEGFELLGEELKLSQGAVDAPEQEKENSKLDGLKGAKSSTSSPTTLSKWKSILNSVAKQVSQVPISLGIGVASLRGTLRLYIKPPPSDQIWFGFTCMPEIEFNLESSFGEHKITNGHIATFFINRLKTAVKDTLVIPNRECVCISLMLAEKDDWVPRNVAPFMWLHQESNSDVITALEVPIPVSGESKTSIEDKEKSSSNSEPPKIPMSAPSMLPPVTECSVSPILESVKPELSDIVLTKPEKESMASLLKNDNESPETSQQNRNASLEWRSSSKQNILAEERNLLLEDDEGKPKRTGRRARMLDLGKKMSEKLEEKRRNIEEKSRNLVEKILEERKAGK